MRTRKIGLLASKTIVHEIVSWLLWAAVEPVSNDRVDQSQPQAAGRRNAESWAESLAERTQSGMWKNPEANRLA
jgi:hypothetical protein